jgi:lipoyl(octanoyl) transferase
MSIAAEKIGTAAKRKFSQKQPLLFALPETGRTLPPPMFRVPLLHVWPDDEFRPVAMQMALDEALLNLSLESSLESGSTLLRWYGWDAPARTIGYGDPAALVDGEQPWTRRCTGGGLVEHGEDLTLAVAYPAGSTLAKAPAPERYRWMHIALQEAAQAAAWPLQRAQGIVPTHRQACFAAPVDDDLLDPDNGRKIVGGAQRRTRGAVLHQGSLRVPTAWRDPRAPWLDRFHEILAETIVPMSPKMRDDLLERAAILSRDRYETISWKRRIET